MALRTDNYHQEIVVEHYRTDPVTVIVDVDNKTAIRMALEREGKPPVRQLTNTTLKFPWDRRLLTTLVPEPALDGHGVDRKYGELLGVVNDLYEHKTDVRYVLPGLYPAWVASEFGVTSFPSIVVHQEFPGRSFVYQGDMSKESVLLLLEDVLAGCTNLRQAPRGTALSKKSERLVCDAGPVLQDL